MYYTYQIFGGSFPVVTLMAFVLAYQLSQIHCVVTALLIRTKYLDKYCIMRHPLIPNPVAIPSCPQFGSMRDY